MKRRPKATLFAVADEVPASVGYLTAGKQYEVLPTSDNTAFLIVGDAGFKSYCLWEGCAHLDGGNWQRVEQSK